MVPPRNIRAELAGSESMAHGVLESLKDLAREPAERSAG